MAVLNQTVLPNAGPYVRFATTHKTNLDELAVDVPKDVFCELPIDLIGTYCSITHTYSPFDVNDQTKLRAPYDIYLMASNLMMWEFQLARTPDNYFLAEAEFWGNVYQSTQGQYYSAGAFKADLIESLHFIIEKFVDAAANKKCIVIAGV